MNVARLNFSHGDHEAHGATLARLREVAAEKSRNIGESSAHLILPIVVSIFCYRSTSLQTQSFFFVTLSISCAPRYQGT